MSIEINHPHIISPIYELVKVLEFDIDLGDDRFPLRLEIFRSLADNCLFRARIWRTEFFRIQSTFPQEENSQPSHDPSDELILLDFSDYLTKDYENFRANSLESAIALIIKDLQQFLDKTNNLEAK
ncbi:MAG: hypothetical protein QNJ38_07745 [Prochloraceae cyanobacterium]|nr:hypothetical protein [Prochloraceae cyanobacterium]